MRLARFERSLIPGIASLIAVAVLLSPAPATPAAPPPPPDPKEMVTNGKGNLVIARDRMLKEVTDAPSTLKSIRELTDVRRTAHRVIALDYPLDDFTGIVIADSYDAEYIAVVDTLIDRYVEIDPQPPTPEDLARIREAVGQLPPIADSPAGFVVAYVIGKMIAAPAQLPAETTPEQRAGAEKAALRVIGGLTGEYRAAHYSTRAREADDAWHLSVLERIRCPTHHCGYVLDETRNGLRADGGLYRRYVVHCESGKEERKLDFDLGEMSALTLSKGRQALKAPTAKPDARLPGVTP